MIQTAYFFLILTFLLTACGSDDDQANTDGGDTGADGDTDTDTDTDSDTDSDGDTDTDTDTDSDTDSDGDTDTDTDTDSDTDSDGDTDTDTDTDTDSDTSMPPDGGDDGGVDGGDNGGDTDTDASPPDACGFPPGGPEQGTHVLRFENNNTAVYLKRVYDGVGTGESFLFHLDAMVIALSGKCITIGHAGALDYENTHHNWADVAKGSNHSVIYELAMTYDGSSTDGYRWHISLSLIDATTDLPIGDAVELIATGGPNGSHGTAWDTTVYISEFMPSASDLYQDDAGENAPWIELFNPGSGDFDLSGYHLSNDPETPTLWTFPEGTVIGRHEYLVVAADDQTDQGPLHTNFVLSPEGGSVMFTSKNGTGGGERDYTASPDGHSLVLDLGSDTYIPSDTPTPGAENQ